MTVTNELMFEVLKAIQADVAAMRIEISDVKNLQIRTREDLVRTREDMNRFESDLLRFERIEAGTHLRLDRIEARLELRDT